MPKYELSLTKDYVPDWGVTEAVRELFQNALDQQETVPDNEMFFEYEPQFPLEGEFDILRIGNKSSVLEPKSLLLGATTKADDSKTIGKFGEGYKVATLVLLRLGKTVTFYNYGAREVWRPRFVKSRRYGTDILTFFVDKKFVWQKVPDHNLTIEVEGITVEEYKDIVESNLHLQKETDIVANFPTKYGRILLNDEHKGKVFVNGLFVHDYQPYEYGYDFKPEHLKLDRDRKLVSDFDLKWLASKMWGEMKNTAILLELIKKDAADVTYVQHTATYTNADEELTDRVAKDFQEEHGPKAIPISNQEEAELVPRGYKGIIVNTQYKELITTSSSYRPVPLIARRSFKGQVEDWLSDWEDQLPEEARKALEAILEEEEEG